MTKYLKFATEVIGPTQASIPIRHGGFLPAAFPPATVISLWLQTELIPACGRRCGREEMASWSSATDAERQDFALIPCATGNPKHGGKTRLGPQDNADVTLSVSGDKRATTRVRAGAGKAEVLIEPMKAGHQLRRARP